MQPSQTPTSTALVPRKRAQAAAKVDKSDKKLRISPKIRQCIGMLVSGEARTQKEAATIAGIDHVNLCKQLKRDHINDYYQREIKRKLLGSGTINLAALRMISLIDDPASAKVMYDASDRLLTAAGVLPSAKGHQSTTVNVGVSVGYVIDLT